MKVKELIRTLGRFNPEAEILLSSDEELNTLFKDIEVGTLDKNQVVIWGNSGSELE